MRKRRINTLDPLPAVLKALMSCQVPSALPGVYLLILNKVCIYVGQSRNALSRCSGHRLVTVDKIQMIPESDERLRLELEKDFIQVLRPRMNVRETRPLPILDSTMMCVTEAPSCFTLATDEERDAFEKTLAAPILIVSGPISGPIEATEGVLQAISPGKETEGAPQAYA